MAEQLLQAEVQADIVLEPERRDSAAAVAVAALHAARRDPEAVVMILAADHVIGDTAAFVEAARAAAVGAQAGRIMTLGIEPTAPSTAYGYIRKGAPIDGVEGAYDVGRFVEKPNRHGAESLIADGALWNSGYFLFRADVMLAELETYVRRSWPRHARPSTRRRAISISCAWIPPPSPARRRPPSITR